MDRIITISRNLYSWQARASRVGCLNKPHAFLRLILNDSSWQLQLLDAYKEALTTLKQYVTRDPGACVRAVKRLLLEPAYDRCRATDAIVPEAEMALLLLAIDVEVYEIDGLVTEMQRWIRVHNPKPFATYAYLTSVFDTATVTSGSIVQAALEFERRGAAHKFLNQDGDVLVCTGVYDRDQDEERQVREGRLRRSRSSRVPHSFNSPHANRSAHVPSPGRPGLAKPASLPGGLRKSMRRLIKNNGGLRHNPRVPVEELCSVYHMTGRCSYASRGAEFCYYAQPGGTEKRYTHLCPCGSQSLHPLKACTRAWRRRDEDAYGPPQETRSGAYKANKQRDASSRDKHGDKRGRKRSRSRDRKNQRGRR